MPSFMGKIDKAEPYIQLCILVLANQPKFGAAAWGVGATGFAQISRQVGVWDRGFEPLILVGK